MSQQPNTQSAITRWLQQQSSTVFALYAVMVAFTGYFCVYAFRKPFAVGVFAGTVSLPFLPPIDYKIVLIISQVFGYALSKFIGIKLVSELGAARRAAVIAGFLIMAEVSLALFALTPKPYNAVFLFLNGLPLGTVWGLIFGYLEGRKLTEVLGAGLSASYIVASGFVKTVGLWLIALGVSELWMPCVVGALFLPLALACVWLLNQLPPPTAEDEALRTKRTTMSAQSRRRFFNAYAPGLLCLIALYVVLTAFRDFRDNFARELWDALGYSNMPSVLTSAEIPIAIGVLVVLASMMWIKDNQKALLCIHLIMIAGTALIGVSTLALQLEWISPVVWMVLSGLGLYVAYVPFGCILFDRLIAAVGVVGTSGFLIYVADSFGYLGCVVVLLYKSFGHPHLAWMPFFMRFGYITSILCSVSFAISMMYFWRKTKAGVAAAPPIDSLAHQSSAA